VGKQKKSGWISTLLGRQGGVWWESIKGNEEKISDPSGWIGADVLSRNKKEKTR